MIGTQITVWLAELSCRSDLGVRKEYVLSTFTEDIFK